MGRKRRGKRELRRWRAGLLAGLLGFTVPTAAAAELSRGEAIRLLWQGFGGMPYDRTAHPFGDVFSLPDPLPEAIAWAYGTGLTQGCGGGRFAPERPLTRAEGATLLRRAATHLGRDTFLPDGASECNDGEEATIWGGDDLYWACISGVLPWTEGGLFSPTATVEEETWRDCLDRIGYTSPMAP